MTMFFIRTINVIIKLLKRKILRKIKKYSGWKDKKPRRIMLLSNCVVFSIKKMKVIKKQEAKELLSMIDKIPLLGPLLI